MAGSRLPDVTNAAVDSLVADSTLCGTGLLNGTKVYTHIPEDTVPPYVLVLGGREVPWARSFNRNGADDERDCEVMVTAVSAYRGTKQLDDLIHQSLVTLTKDTAWSSVTGYAGVLFGENQRPTMELVNGQVYYQRTAIVHVYVS